MNIHRPAVIGFGILMSLLTFQIVRAANSAFQGSTSFGSITDGESVQLVGSSFTSAPLPLSTVEGRLTLTSGTPVTTSDVTGATTIYFTPYKGDRIYLYDGTRWKLYSFSELSLALGTVTSGLPYDVFLYDNGGTLTLEKLAWTNGTTRATALTTQNGVLVKSGAATRRYLGTFYTTSTTTTEDSAAKRLVWNYYNRVERKLKVTESTSSWTYGTATWRSANNSTANRVELVSGWPEALLDLTVYQFAYPDATEWGNAGIAEDATNTNHADIFGVAYSPSTAIWTPLYSHLAKYPAVGYHYYQWTEYAGAGTVEFEGTWLSGVAGRIAGLLGSIWG